MFEVRAAYLPQVSSCAVENELSYSGDELRAMGEQMVVTFDLAGAFDDLPLPLKRRRQEDLALVQDTASEVLLWTRDALALLDRAANILGVGAQVIPDDPTVAAIDAFGESDEESHVSASFALTLIARPQWLRERPGRWWGLALYRILDGCRNNRLPGGQADLREAMRALEPALLALPELVERIYHSWPTDQMEARDSRATLDLKIAELKMLISTVCEAGGRP